MIWLTPLAVAGALATAAAAIYRASDSAAARSIAVRAVTAVALGTTGITIIELHLAERAATAWLAPPTGLALVPIAFSLTALVIVSLAPLASHPPRTLARVLLLLAVATAALSSTAPAAIAAAWLASTWIAWTEFRERAPGGDAARLFATYHSASSALAVAGAAGLALGSPAVGIPLLIAGIAIRQAIVPLHSWLPQFVEAMPLGIVVAFIAPQLGLYAHLALLVDGIPGEIATAIAATGAFTAVIAAGLGIVQSDARRALAFLIISQTGLVAFGLENHSPVARAGASAAWLALAVATTGFAMTLAALEARRGRLSLHIPTGNFARTPRLAVALLFFGFASVGFPATLGFVAEDLLVQGSVAEFPALCLALIAATALNGITVMRAFLYLFSGSARHGGELDLQRRELRALTIAMMVLLLAGLFPQPLVSLVQPRPAAATDATAAAP